MKVGVDATIWQNNRGYGRHARALLSHLVAIDSHDQFVFFVDSAQNIELIPPQVEVHHVRSSLPTTLAASAQGSRSIRDMLQMSQRLSASEFDILLFPTVYSFVPVLSRAKKILMIHDIIPEKYPELTLPTRKARLFWSLKSAIGRFQADAIVTVSDYSQRCIADHFSISPQKIWVVGEASDPIFRPLENPALSTYLASIGLPARGRFVVYVGGFGPHKNLDNLISIFARLATQGEFSDILLVMVGEYQQEVFYSSYSALRKQIDELGVAQRLIFTGYLPDEDLVVLLNLAEVLVLPSRMEGFGLPAVEAAACGCPVIATQESPLPALLGEGGLYFDPSRPAELEAALQRILKSQTLRSQMRAAGLQAAHALSWDTAARQMIEVLHEVASL